MSAINFANLIGGFVPGYIIQVRPGDSRIGDGTHYGIALTAQLLSYAFCGVKNWTVVGPQYSDWWNSYPPTPNAVALPGGNNYLPNNNVWSVLGASGANGNFIYPWGNGTDTNVSTPYFTSQAQYPIVTPTDLSGVMPMTTGLDGNGFSFLPSVGLDITSIYFDGTSYYPKVFAIGGDSWSTDKSILGPSPDTFGTLTFLGQTTTIYTTAGSGQTGNITWTDAQRW